MNAKKSEIKPGCFYQLKQTIVYVNRIVETMAYVTFADQPTWHKKVPVCCLKKIRAY